MADPEKFTRYSSTCLIVPNFVAVDHTVLAPVGVPKFLGERWGHAPLGLGVTDALETRYSPKCVSTPNFVALGQTVWA